MMTSKAQQFLESWREAEKYHQEFAQRTDPVAHHFNKIISHHLEVANGNDRKTRGRAKAVLRHFVKWQTAEQEHHEKHKKFPTMDDLAAGKPKAIKAWRAYQRNVAPKEKRYHRESWMLQQQTDLADLKKGKVRGNNPPIQKGIQKP